MGQHHIYEAKMPHPLAWRFMTAIATEESLARDLKLCLVTFLPVTSCDWRSSLSETEQSAGRAVHLHVQ
jgi:hypothetical protein